MTRVNVFNGRVQAADAIGVDLGATTLKVVRAGADGAICARARVAHEHRTPDPQAVVASIAGAIDAVAVGGRPAVVGVAVPGVLDDARTTVEVAANLGWRDGI